MRRFCATHAQILRIAFGKAQGVAVGCFSALRAVSLLHDAAKAKTPQDAAWIGSADFVQVCALAQVDPLAVLRCYRPERFMRLGKAA